MQYKPVENVIMWKYLEFTTHGMYKKYVGLQYYLKYETSIFHYAFH